MKTFNFVLNVVLSCVELKSSWECMDFHGKISYLKCFPFHDHCFDSKKFGCFEKARFWTFDFWKFYFLHVACSTCCIASCAHNEIINISADLSISFGSEKLENVEMSPRAPDKSNLTLQPCCCPNLKTNGVLEKKYESCTFQLPRYQRHTWTCIIFMVSHPEILVLRTSNLQG